MQNNLIFILLCFFFHYWIAIHEINTVLKFIEDFFNILKFLNYLLFSLHIQCSLFFLFIRLLFSIRQCRIQIRLLFAQFITADSEARRLQIANSVWVNCDVIARYLLWQRYTTLIFQWSLWIYFGIFILWLFLEPISSWSLEFCWVLRSCKFAAWHIWRRLEILI